MSLRIAYEEATAKELMNAMAPHLGNHKIEFGVDRSAKSDAMIFAAICKDCGRYFSRAVPFTELNELGKVGIINHSEYFCKTILHTPCMSHESVARVSELITVVIRDAGGKIHAHALENYIADMWSIPHEQTLDVAQRMGFFDALENVCRFPEDHPLYVRHVHETEIRFGP